MLSSLSDDPALDVRRHEHFLSPSEGGRRSFRDRAKMAIQSILKRSTRRRAVIVTSLPLDHSVGALLHVLVENGFKTKFCREEVNSCLAPPPDGQVVYSFAWLKREGHELAERVRGSVVTINSFGAGWKMWSRRSLCLASSRNARWFNGSSGYIDWHPPCFNFPARAEDVYKLKGSEKPWILHSSSQPKKTLFRSGSEAIENVQVGVLQANTACLACLPADSNVKEYISSPLLIYGKKFSLRFYVAVTSLNPLRSYIFDDANVALAREAFSGASEEGHRTSEVEGDAKMKSVLEYLNASGLEVGDLERKIEERIAVAVLSACTLHSSPVDGASRLRRFKLLAVHVLIDSSLSPWVVKIDPSPNLNVRSISKPSAKPLQKAFRKLLAAQEDRKKMSWLTRFNTIRLFSRMRQTAEMKDDEFTPGTKLRVDMLSGLLKLLDVHGISPSPKKRLTEELLLTSLEKKISSCVNKSIDEMTSKSSESSARKQVSGKQISAIVAFEQERRRLKGRGVASFVSPGGGYAEDSQAGVFEEEGPVPAVVDPSSEVTMFCECGSNLIKLLCCLSLFQV
ncbi:hypothetical protein GUITHDRAFT_111801 [Guillardia theta CCMP2712]|uniref:Uncharacterized protein n=1 Tax=Guillardia theta (strain CCMP2712) TaxID=905079 RepID=L1J2B9_GUITC|nr:hypothetical protein GUITHDRAFT_111801 [Guillardia theta CCMP2712]EKX42240.1 hypothetical protein GUITHDRAFT_111801 [Guillardia theta CCMP2712]|eukprot:XP_005829220.1 hypothetical protein GUITHDRAFT_111801 [Guillardia theta CCMP2712]